MTAEELRKVRGGVIGGFTPKEIVVDIAEKPALGATGDHAVGIKVPAGKLVYGAYIKNMANDFVGAGANLGVKVGNTAIMTAVAATGIKGAGAGELASTPAVVAGDVKLTVASAAATAGKLVIGVIYG